MTERYLLDNRTDIKEAYKPKEGCKSDHISVCSKYASDKYADGDGTIPSFNDPILRSVMIRPQTPQLISKIFLPKQELPFCRLNNALSHQKITKYHI